MLTEIGLLKSGNLMKWWKLERRDLFVSSPLVCSQSTRTDFLLMTMIWTLTPSQNQTCKWSIAKDIGPILKRCNKRQRHAFFNMVNVYVLNIGSICIHGKGLLRKFTLHQRYREQSHNDSDVWHIWKIDSWTIRWDLWSEHNELGCFLMETLIFGRWWSHRSLAREGLRIFIFSVKPRKEAPEPTIKYCLGKQVDVVQEFITIQNFGHTWWWANGFRVEYFPRIHRIAALQQCPRVHVKNERSTRRIYKTDYLHVDVQPHLMVTSRQGTGMRI